MRTDKRFDRVRNMITAPEVPRLANGGLALCHFCQRAIYFAGGFVQLLIEDVQREAIDAAIKMRQRASVKPL